MLKRLSVILLATVGFAAMAQAADLPTKKEAAPAAPAKPDCSTLWAWFQHSATDCPLSAYGFTVYGTLDVNAFYSPNGGDFSPVYTQPWYGAAKTAHTVNGWRFGYNGLSTSNVGIKMKQDLGPLGLKDWSLIGVLDAGVNPYSGMFINGPRSLADNNVRPGAVFPWQSTNADSSRNGAWYNGQAYLGVSNPTYGTLTFGRTNSLSLDVTSAYDPIGGSIAYSLIGYSSSFAGFGNTETVRNTAVTYRLAYQNFRAAAQIGVGGYAWDNANTGIYQGQLGADFGGFSIDGVASYAQNAVSLSSYGINPVGNTAIYPKTAALTDIAGNWFVTQKNIYGINQFYNTNSIVKGTLSNNLGFELTGKYKWNTVTFYGGWIYARLGDPSNAEANGFDTITRGLSVPSGAVTSTAYLNNGAINAPSYAENRILNTVWTGAKYSVLPNLDLMAGVYYQTQNSYATNWNTGKINGVPYGFATGTGCVGHSAYIQSVNTNGSLGAVGSGSKCGGSQSSVSIAIDYRPVGRLDIYAGVMYNQVYGGLAAGYFSTYSTVYNNKVYSWNVAHTSNWDPSIGIRFRF